MAKDINSKEILWCLNRIYAAITLINLYYKDSFLPSPSFTKFRRQFYILLFVLSQFTVLLNLKLSFLNQIGLNNLNFFVPICIIIEFPKKFHYFINYAIHYIRLIHKLLRIFIAVIKFRKALFCTNDSLINNSDLRLLSKASTSFSIEKFVQAKVCIKKNPT